MDPYMVCLFGAVTAIAPGNLHSHVPFGWLQKIIKQKSAKFKLKVDSYLIGAFQSLVVWNKIEMWFC